MNNQPDDRQPRGLAALKNAFIRPYSPSRVDRLAKAVKELNHEEKTNVWLDKQQDKDKILGAIRQRMEKKANKQQVAVISSLLSALTTVREERFIDLDQLKRLRSTNVSQSSNDKLEDEVAYYRKRIGELVHSLQNSKRDLQKYKYYLGKSHDLNVQLRSLVDVIPYQQKLALSEISGVITTMEKEDQKNTQSLDLDAFHNQMEGSMNLDNMINQNVNPNKQKHRGLWEVKAQKMMQILEDLLPPLI